MRENVLAYLLTFNLLSFVYSVPSLVDTTKCKKRSGNFPKVGSYCKSYYSCSDWIPEEFECFRDEHFFPEKGYCVTPEMYPCFEKPKSKECPLPKGKFLKPNTGCKEYYDCCNGEATVKSCQPGLLFSHNRGTCDWSELVTCPDEEPKFKECLHPSGKFLKPRTGCRIYYDCSNGIATKKKCPMDQLFNPKSESCEWPEIYSCIENSCQPNPCKYDGVCTEDMGKAVCACKEPYTGDTCEINVCDPNPCKNEGVCSVKEDKVRCSCADSYAGDRCEKDLCLPNPCSNNGTCRVTRGEITCSCKDPFTGDKCEKNLCSPNPCSNNGKCSVRNGKITCDCKDPFTGEKCEKNLCLPNPCLNDGECSARNGKIFCSCRDPFIGEKCEKNLCLPNPCLNNGECSARNGKIYCSCRDPFIGENCEKNLCLPNPCLNNGECSARNGKISCSCRDPFIGEKCEKNLCYPNPCFNNGTCNVTKGKITCSCVYPFTGEKCENDTRTRESTTHQPTSTVTISISCPHSDDYFPHPTNRHKFIACIGGNPIVMDCASNLVYDHERRSCEYDKI